MEISIQASSSADETIQAEVATAAHATEFARLRVRYHDDCSRSYPNYASSAFTLEEGITLLQSKGSAVHTVYRSRTFVT